jgi:hypothetical protein
MLFFSFPSFSFSFSLSFSFFPIFCTPPTAQTLAPIQFNAHSHTTQSQYPSTYIY